MWGCVTKNNKKNKKNINYILSILTWIELTILIQ